MTRRAAWFAALILAWSTAFAGSGPDAFAQAASQQGWWTAANPGPPLPTPAPPDVPADGLLVQGGSSDASPTAYAALVYEVPAGATVGQLTLVVTPGSGTTPSATPRACLLSNAFSPEQGGPIANAPAYDCSKKSTGQPSSSGDSYHFDVSALAAGGVLAVAILPASATDRVVFNKPGADSLAVTEPVAPTPAPPDAGSAVLDTGPSGVATSPSADTAAALPADVSQSSQPVTADSVPTGAAPPVPQVAAPSSAAGSTPSAASAPASGGSGGGTAPALIGLAIGGLLLAAALWAYAGRSAEGSLPT